MSQAPIVFRFRLTGAQRISIERKRQMEQEGYDEAHDAGHAEELAMAAATYAMSPSYRSTYIGRSPLWSLFWPWAQRYYKPKPQDRIRELEKAGALIAAAIDSLQAET